MTLIRFKNTLILPHKMSKLKRKENVSKEMTFKDNDKLNRESIAENFNLLFKEVSQPFVIALDSSWGTGKTQFIHMWRNLLKKEAKTIYLNLWEEDFLKNPFFSLTETLFKEFEKENIGESQTRQDLKKIGWELSRAAVSKVFNLDIDNLVDENFNYTQRKNKEKFRKNLEELALKVREQTGSPLLIFIDELDRCRPDYAIEFLEIIKHFFDIQNIIFVLGIDMEQLKHSVKSVYGEGMDAEEYLRKFVDIKYSFPEPQIENYLEHLFKEFKCGDKDVELVSISKEIIKLFRPTLRKIDHLFIRLKLMEEDINDSYVQASFFLALKTFEERNYDKIIKKQCTKEEILGLIKYFEITEKLLTKIIFWRLVNELILESSGDESEYRENLKFLFSNLVKKWSNIREILLNYKRTSRGFRDQHFSIASLTDIFSKDLPIKGERNIKIISSIFHSKKHHLGEFYDLIKKIDFLEGLSFSREKEEEK